MNFFTKGTDFVSSKTDLLPVQAQNEVSSFSGNFDGFERGTDFINSKKELARNHFQNENSTFGGYANNGLDQLQANVGDINGTSILNRDQLSAFSHQESAFTNNDISKQSFIKYRPTHGSREIKLDNMSTLAVVVKGVKNPGHQSNIHLIRDTTVRTRNDGRSFVRDDNRHAVRSEGMLGRDTYQHAGMSKEVGIKTRDGVSLMINQRPIRSQTYRPLNIERQEPNTGRANSYRISTQAKAPNNKNGFGQTRHGSTVTGLQTADTGGKNQKHPGMIKSWSESADNHLNNSDFTHKTIDTSQDAVDFSKTKLGDKFSEGKEKIGAYRDKLGDFNGVKNETNQQSTDIFNKEEGNIFAIDMNNIDGMELPFGEKEKSDNIMDKFPGDPENGGFMARVDNTRGPSCTYTVGIVVRLTLIVVNVLTIVRTILVTNNYWNWGCAPVCAIFMALEYSRVVFKRLGKEWTWWVPCLLVFLVTTLPLIWQLQLNNLDTEEGLPHNTDIWTIVASDAVVYLTIFARWLLQGGVITLTSLASVIMDFIANASDIMDLLSLTDQSEVRASTMLMYWVLAAWSVSFVKFIPLIDIDGKNKDSKPLPEYILQNFGPNFTEALQIIFTLVLLDGSFLVIRLYLLVGEGVVTFSLVFFIVKNVISFGILLNRMISVCRSMPCNQRQAEQ